MLELERHKGFMKEFGKIKFTNEQHSKYARFVAALLEQRALPAEAKDHQLKGELKEFREFHLGGDLLVIYKIDNKKLSLARIGTHSELFE